MEGVVDVIIVGERRSESNGAKKLGKLGFGVRVHTDDDDQRDEAVVGDDLCFFHGPIRPLLHALTRCSLLRTLRPLRALPFRLQ